MRKKLAIEIISGLLIMLFIYAAASKLIDHEKFRIEIGKSPVLTKIATLTSWVIPVAEVSISVLLASGKYRLIGLYSSFSLLTLFTSYLVAILQFSFYVPCTCGGVLQNMGWQTHIIFNCVFILLSLTGIILQTMDNSKNKTENSIDPYSLKHNW